ncbi:MAG: ABC transporter substrate-binding protein [Candidatus Competibacteraceae bacterium]
MFVRWSKSMKSWLVRIQPTLLAVILMAMSNLQALAEEVGVTSSTIRIGGVMALEGDGKGLGLGMKTGISAALNGEKIQNRVIEFIVLNDFYNPADTVKSTRKLIDQGIFLMLGNVGTPTTKAVLPILVENNIPAVGFFTGSDILRPGVGDIINFRASYIQEISQMVEAAFSTGVQPSEVCAYVQNDSYGMAGLLGLKTVLEKQPGMTDTVHKLEQILAIKGENSNPNGIGPVGVYQRDTNLAREGYLSLKQWEQVTGTHCRLVVTTGTYAPVADFITYSRYKGDNWIFSAVSFTGADNLAQALRDKNITGQVILTNVVPSLDSPLPIVEEARRAWKSVELHIPGRIHRWQNVPSHRTQYQGRYHPPEFYEGRAWPNLRLRRLEAGFHHQQPRVQSGATDFSQQWRIQEHHPSTIG